MFRSKPYLENLGERFDDSGIFVAVGLEDVDKGNFRLGSVAKGLDDGRVFLHRISFAIKMEEDSSLPLLHATRALRSGLVSRSSRRMP